MQSPPPSNGPIEALPQSISVLLDPGITHGPQTLGPVRDHLAAMARHLRDQELGEMADLLKAVRGLLEDLVKRGSASSGAILTTVRESLTAAERSLKLRASRDPLAARFGSMFSGARHGGSSDMGATSLRLINHRRLGEILVSLSMVREKDIETALRMQKVTGTRLGEVLVEMGLLNEGQLESAMRLQDSRARDNGLSLGGSDGTNSQAG